jgi:hypothetical protein
VLNLATMWEMDDLRSTVVSKLSATDPVRDAAQQIRLALKFSISGWIPNAVETLVCRSEIPSPQEVQAMGVDMAITIWSVRERNRSRIVDELRKHAHQRLWDAGDVNCGCVGCRYSREVTGSSREGRKEAADVNYAELRPDTRREVRLMDVSVPESLI